MTDYDVLTSTRIPNSESAPAGARSFIADHRAIWMDRATLADALLLVSEVVTNAMKHGGVEDSLDLMVRISPEVLWCGVAQPAVFSGASEASDGFGLGLIDILSTRWGTLDWAGGTLVWFEIDRDRHVV